MPSLDPRWIYFSTLTVPPQPPPNQQPPPNHLVGCLKHGLLKLVNLLRAVTGPTMNIFLYSNTSLRRLFSHHPLQPATLLHTKSLVLRLSCFLKRRFRAFESFAYFEAFYLDLTINWHAQYDFCGREECCLFCPYAICYNTSVTELLSSSISSCHIKMSFC